MSRDYGITKLYPYRDSANRLAFRGDVGVDGTTLFYPIRVGGQMLLRGACSDGVLYGYPFRAGDQLYARTLAADVISPPRINWYMTCRYWWDSCGGALPLRYQMSGHWAHCGGEKFSAAKDFYVTGDSTGILWWTGRSATSFCNSGCKWGTEELGIEGSVWSHDTYPEAVGGKYLAFDGTVVLIGRNEGDYVGEFMTSLRAYPLGTSYSNWPCANFGRPTPDTDCGVITGSWTDPDPGACASESACFAWLQPGGTRTHPARIINTRAACFPQRWHRYESVEVFSTPWAVGAGRRSAPSGVADRHARQGRLVRAGCHLGSL